jgi:hypothetical protein
MLLLLPNSWLVSLPPPLRTLAGFEAAAAGLLITLLFLLLLLLPLLPLLPLLLLSGTPQLLLLLSSHANSCAAHLPVSRQELLALLLLVLLLHTFSSCRQARGAPARDRWLAAAGDAPAASTK